MSSSPIVPKSLTCPKCGGNMPKLAIAEDDAWRCEQCKGLWLGMNAYAHLREQADAIDTGAVAADRPNNADDHRTMPCPYCVDRELIHMVDSAQPHIHFESCLNCYGRYYDAGEFRDVSEETWREHIGALIETLRLNLAPSL
ncbi:zf-TFIIB domain-containing protein [Solilutibacter silvestris]|uniref:zf-TFIIB domain-containing protein n=1 Tax=Solilutibacter silvestris TaxID=1645665 RepID=UPI003D32BC0E